MTDLILLLVLMLGGTLGALIILLFRAHLSANLKMGGSVRMEGSSYEWIVVGYESNFSPSSPYTTGNRPYAMGTLQLALKEDYERSLRQDHR